MLYRGGQRFESPQLHQEVRTSRGAKEWTYFRYDAHEIIDAGDTIVVPVKTDALSIRGIRMQNEHLFLFKIRDGRPVYARLYADTARGRDVIAGEEPRHYPKPDPT
jgi:uncharacterized protein